jgi:hypothetical protein
VSRARSDKAASRFREGESLPGSVERYDRRFTQKKMTSTVSTFVKL